MHKGLKWLSVLTTIGMLMVLLGGALVTKTESGAGCGTSWPLCHGQIIPEEFPLDTVIELAHRLVSGVVGLLVLALSIATWRKIGYIRETKFLSFVSFIVLVLQGLIGAAAVKWGQSDFVLALHFGISLISFAAVFLLTLLIFEVDKKFNADTLRIDKKMRVHMVAITVYSYLVVYSGALVRHTKSSLVCPDWPLCRNDASFLPTNMYEWIQMGHRGAAGLIFIWIIYLFVTSYKHYRDQKIIYYGWLIALILVSLQVLTGALIIITKLALLIALAHALIISLLFGLLSYFILQVSRVKR
ncbi:heme A synthase [Bacillus coahuilensis p1.1.43]|uniref:Heme A synthase n=1 Tax=Bacillus coahuilensis p1.1.43 TaxID=1150625 RepID=A0A147KA43_9BACI|nr:heme A synthase [Bacillus coahuilensis]KUP07434.1 heme A synthase [Bacillus coahuilensis p1.1.43]